MRLFPLLGSVLTDAQVSNRDLHLARATLLRSRLERTGTNAPIHAPPSAARYLRRRHCGRCGNARATLPCSLARALGQLCALHRTYYTPPHCTALPVGFALWSMRRGTQLRTQPCEHPPSLSVSPRQAAVSTPSAWHTRTVRFARTPPARSRVRTPRRRLPPSSHLAS